jgi:hypothetical protein
MICFTYVFPCVWEDHCKVGFSKDPLKRLEAFHQRWFEVFDLERGFLIETDNERDARNLELQLRRPLVDLKAPKPTTVRNAAGGHTEWLRGAFSNLEAQSQVLERAGYSVHRPSQVWLAARLRSRMDRLYSWSAAQWSVAQMTRGGEPQILEGLKTTLDAYAALDLDFKSSLPLEVAQWYFLRSEFD